MNSVWISALGLCGASIIGSVIGYFVKDMPHRWNDAVLGYCAGIMLAASTVGLILPAVEAVEGYAVWLVVGGVICGGLFLNLLDMVTPHLHTITGLDAEVHRNNRSLNRVLLFVLAIALHKLPEGLAAGVSMNETSGMGWTVSFGLALQNVPEGMVIIAPLLVAGVSRWRTFAISVAIGLLEVAGVWIGYGVGTVMGVLLPALLGFAGGAMLYVTSDEMIPETHAHGFQKQATYALLFGFLTLVLLERITI
ncbi:MAG: ZIP family metal transporter [Bacteroidaceae bacterium]|nr:ZIP family metal transporter [Prevotellaceae bacterium]MDY2849333.1 ZIP family metal transporter [Bacteroidaceae bacterium]